MSAKVNSNSSCSSNRSRPSGMSQDSAAPARSQSNALGYLPTDILINIVERLSVRDQDALGLSSTSFRKTMDVLSVFSRASASIALVGRVGWDEASGQFNSSYVYVGSRREGLSPERLYLLLTGLIHTLNHLEIRDVPQACRKVIAALPWLPPLWRVALFLDLEKEIIRVPEQDRYTAWTALETLRKTFSEEESFLFQLARGTWRYAVQEMPGNPDDAVAQCLPVLDQLAGARDLTSQLALLVIVPLLGETIVQPGIAEKLLVLARSQTVCREKLVTDLAGRLKLIFSSHSSKASAVDPDLCQEWYDYISARTESLSKEQAELVHRALLNLVTYGKTRRPQRELLLEVGAACLARKLDDFSIWSTLLVQLEQQFVAPLAADESAIVKALLIHFAEGDLGARASSQLIDAVKLTLVLPQQDARQVFARMPALACLHAQDFSACAASIAEMIGKFIASPVAEKLPGEAMIAMAMALRIAWKNPQPILMRLRTLHKQGGMVSNPELLVKDVSRYRNAWQIRFLIELSDDYKPDDSQALKILNKLPAQLDALYERDVEDLFQMLFERAQPHEDADELLGGLALHAHHRGPSAFDPVPAMCLKLPARAQGRALARLICGIYQERGCAKAVELLNTMSESMDRLALGVALAYIGENLFTVMAKQMTSTASSVVGPAEDLAERRQDMLELFVWMRRAAISLPSKPARADLLVKLANHVRVLPPEAQGIEASKLKVAAAKISSACKARVKSALGKE